MAFFIVSACLNGTYCSFWDLNYDWSMPLNIYSKPYPLLRPVLAYRKRVWWYYAAMLLDPILRFNWIFYVIYKDDIQHSSLISFFVGFSEVIRRGIWVLFRVENEHCANVGRSRAMRDPELPYQIKSPRSDYRPGNEMADGPADETTAADGSVAHAPVTSGRDVETGLRTPASLRQRRQDVVEESPVYRALQRAGTTFLTAHAQDYERKRKPSKDGSKRDDGDEEDDDTDSEGE